MSDTNKYLFNLLTYNTLELWNLVINVMESCKILVLLFPISKSKHSNTGVQTKYVVYLLPNPEQFSNHATALNTLTVFLVGTFQYNHRSVFLNQWSVVLS